MSLLRFFIFIFYVIERRTIAFYGTRFYDDDDDDHHHHNNNNNNNNNSNNNNGKHIVNMLKLIRSGSKHLIPHCSFCEKNAF